MVKDERRPDIIDRLVGRGCKLLRLTKYQSILTQLAKFVVTGVIATALDWTAYALLVYLADFDPLIAQLFSFILATLFNFYSNTLWVFNTTRNKTRRRLVTEFFIISIVALVLSEILLAFFIQILPINEAGVSSNEMIAKIITTAIIMVFNFITRKIFLEDHKRHPNTKLKA